MDGQTTIIRIASVTRQIKESKMGTGSYSLTEITDAKTGLKAATFGAWAEGWKEGDEVEVKWEKNTYTDRNGTVRESWKLKNPNAKPAPSQNYQRGGGADENLIIAAALVGPQYATVALTPRIAKEAAEKIKKIAAAIADVPAPVAPAPAPVEAPIQYAPAPVQYAPAPEPQVVPVAQPAPVAPAPAVMPTPANVAAAPAPVDTEFEEDDKPF